MLSVRLPHESEEAKKLHEMDTATIAALIAVGKAAEAGVGYYAMKHLKKKWNRFTPKTAIQKATSRKTQLHSVRRLVSG